MNARRTAAILTPEAEAHVNLFLTHACNRETPPLLGKDWQAMTPTAYFRNVCNWWIAHVCGSNRHFLSAKRLTQALTQKGIVSKKSNVMHYLGITINLATQKAFAAAQHVEMP